MKYYLLALKRYAEFKGRSTRPEYWYFTLFNFIFIVAAMLLDNLLDLNFENTPYGILYAVYALGSFLPGLSAAVRRLHDVNKSGWFLLISLIPLIGSIYMLVVLARKGDASENKYGPDPYTGPTFEFEQQPA